MASNNLTLRENLPAVDGVVAVVLLESKLHAGLRAQHHEVLHVPLESWPFRGTHSQRDLCILHTPLPAIDESVRIAINARESASCPSGKVPALTLQSTSPIQDSHLWLLLFSMQRGPRVKGRFGHFLRLLGWRQRSRRRYRTLLATAPRRALRTPCLPRPLAPPCVGRGAERASGARTRGARPLSVFGHGIRAKPAKSLVELWTFLPPWIPQAVKLPRTHAAACFMSCSRLCPMCTRMLCLCIDRSYDVLRQVESSRVRT